MTRGLRESGRGGPPVNSLTSGSNEPNDSFPPFQLARTTGRTRRMRLGVTPRPDRDHGRATA